MIIARDWIISLLRDSKFTHWSELSTVEVKQPDTNDSNDAETTKKTSAFRNS